MSTHRRPSHLSLIPHPLAHSLSHPPSFNPLRSPQCYLLAGQQNTKEEAHAQLDLFLELGGNFIDTAELYPVPPREETCGLTETYIGELCMLADFNTNITLKIEQIGKLDESSSDRIC
jgi:hypothetical protein